MKSRAIFVAILFLVSCSIAKDQPVQMVVWPEQGTPVIRFSFGKFNEVGSLGNERTYVTDTTAQNLWSKRIPEAAFTLYLFDKNKVRIGQAALSVSNVGPVRP